MKGREVLRPGGGLLVYDGDCGFCTVSAQWAARRVSTQAVVAPWQGLDLEQLGLSAADVETAAWWIAPDGTRHRGSDAAAAALRNIGSFWGVVGAVLAHPPLAWLGHPAYALIARNRHRLPGSTEACRLDDR